MTTSEMLWIWPMMWVWPVLGIVVLGMLAGLLTGIWRKMAQKSNSGSIRETASSHKKGADLWLSQRSRRSRPATGHKHQPDLGEDNPNRTNSRHLKRGVAGNARG